MLSALRGCVLVGLLAVAATTSAAEYAWEVSGARTEAELDVLVDAERSLVSATRYFTPVDDGSGPLALAAFFDPATQISVAASQEKSESHPLGPGSVNLPGFETEEDEYSISGRYLLRQSKWYVGGRYATQDRDVPRELQEVVTSSDVYGVLAGKYLGAATTLELRLERGEQSSEGPSVFCVVNLFCAVGGQATTERETDDVRIDALHVRRFRSLTYALSGSIAEASGEVAFHTSEFDFPLPFPPLGPIVGGPAQTVTIPARTTHLSLPRRRHYSAGVELFPTAKLGARLRYTRFDDDTAAADAYETGLTWFFRRDVAIEFSYSRQSADADADFRHADMGSARVLGRFWLVAPLPTAPRSACAAGEREARSGA